MLESVQIAEEIVQEIKVKNAESAYSNNAYEQNETLSILTSISKDIENYDARMGNVSDFFIIRRLIGKLGAIDLILNLNKRANIIEGKIGVPAKQFILKLLQTDKVAESDMCTLINTVFHELAVRKCYGALSMVSGAILRHAETEKLSQHASEAFYLNFQILLKLNPFIALQFMDAELSRMYNNNCSDFCASKLDDTFADCTVHLKGKDLTGPIAKRLLNSEPIRLPKFTEIAKLVREK